MNYQPVIGLEIHIELKTCSKMFCSCRNDPNERHPNVNVCPICMGHPGVLPVINEEAVRKTIKTGLALNCEISEFSKFDRKNYFYPDLPKGYQISQYDRPLCKNGKLSLVIDGKTLEVRIRRVHLEEDTGRLLHSEKGDYSLVDFNRAGIPLMELVTEPDLNTPGEARKFAEELRLILRYLGVSDADMEKGQLRVEANISLLPQSQQKGQKFGTKVEIKNLNSFRALEEALNYEIKRQQKILKSKKRVIQETRGWDEEKKVTLSQRVKEEEKDYRYFPEPDLPLLHQTPQLLQEIFAQIPELPQPKRERFKKEYQLQDQEIENFVQNKDFGEYFEKVCSELRQWIKEIELKPKVEREEFLKLCKLCSNYMITDLQALLKGRGVSGEDFRITPENFGEFITLIYEGKISSKIAKQILEEMFKTGADPSHIIEEKGLSQLTDEKEIEKIAKEVILENQPAVADYKKGKKEALQFLIGKIMEKTKGRANPQLANKILKKLLS